MNNNIKIIFVDIDSTIFIHPERYFDMPSIEALKKAQENGVKIVITTARPYHASAEIGTYDLIKPDCIVCSNGATIFEHDELIYSDYFEPEYLKQFVKIVNKHNFNCEFIKERSCFLINNHLRKIEYYFELFKQNVPTVDKYTNQPITKILLFMPEKYDEKIIPLLPKPYVGYRFSDTMVDIMPVQAYKGFGVKYLLNYLKIDPSEAMAIGDDTQDISMFNEVEYSVAMGNSTDEIKARAKYVTLAARESGVKDILIKLGVID